MASIDTEFKADLARIEMRFYDLAKLANTLDECFNDIGGVRKRIKFPSWAIPQAKPKRRSTTTPQTSKTHETI